MNCALGLGSLAVISTIYRYPRSPEHVGLHFSPLLKLEDMWLALPWWSWSLGFQLGSWVVKMTAPLTVHTGHMTWPKKKENTSFCCVKPQRPWSYLLLQLGQLCWLMHRLLTFRLGLRELDQVWKNREWGRWQSRCKAVFLSLDCSSLVSLSVQWIHPPLFLDCWLNMLYWPQPPVSSPAQTILKCHFQSVSLSIETEDDRRPQ